MKTKILFVAALVSGLVASVAADAAPPVSVQPVLAKAKTELTMAGYSAVPGEKKTLDILLADAAGKPVSDKQVEIALASKPGQTQIKTVVLGSVRTGTNGHGLLSWACADLPQGNYNLEVNYAGDASTLPSKTTANLLVVKAQATFEFDKMTWGTYKDEPGKPDGVFIFKLIRTSDQKWLDNRTVTMTTNGKAQIINISGGFAQVMLLPVNAKQWDVKLQFDGDAYTLATAGEHTYVHP